MKRIIPVVIVSGVAGLIIGALIMLIVFPFIFPPAEVNENIVSVETAKRIGNGKFVTLDENDPFHRGQGEVSIYQQDQKFYVYLEKNFEVGPGPDMHVYLSSKKNIGHANEFTSAQNLDLGKLKSFRGSQVYEIPAGTEIKNYQSVVIWCNFFGQLISPATL